MSGTTITGNFKDCGPGQKPQIDFVCQGTVCPSFGEFPQGTVADTGNDLDSLSYKSTARCESLNSNYFGSLLFQQAQPEIDARVSQEQNITLPKCKGLHVQSDGTSAGTHVDSIDRTNEPDCAPLPPLSSTPIVIPQSSSIPVGAYILSGLGGGASSSQAGTPATTAIVTPNPTESQPIQYTGNKASQNRPHFGVLIVCFLMISFLVQGSTAYLLPDGNRHVEVRKPFIGPDTLKRTAYNMHLRALSDNIRTFAEEFGGYVAGKVDAVNGNGEVFADNLISETLSTICEGFFSGAVVEAFTPGVVDGCVTAVYTANAVAAPEVEFLSVFGASMFCNYVVAQAFPVAEQFSSEACQGLEDLIKKPPVSTSVSPPVPTIPPPIITESKPLPPIVTESKPLPPIVTESKPLPPIVTESKPLPPIVTESKFPPPIFTESKPPHPNVTESKPPPPVFTESKAPIITHGESKPPVITQNESKPPTITKSESWKPPVTTESKSKLPVSTESAKPCGGADLSSDHDNCRVCGNKCGDFEDCVRGCCVYRNRYGGNPSCTPLPESSESVSISVSETSSKHTTTPSPTSISSSSKSTPSSSSKWTTWDTSSAITTPSSTITISSSKSSSSPSSSSPTPRPTDGWWQFTDASSYTNTFHFDITANDVYCADHHNLNLDSDNNILLDTLCVKITSLKDMTAPIPADTPISFDVMPEAEMCCLYAWSDESCSGPSQFNNCIGKSFLLDEGFGFVAKSFRVGNCRSVYKPPEEGCV
ncbi:hypothetical protein BCR34DRAFT_602470 [Clohesyomyces aquaticus]|uniref:Uncharacterized protein n=1 Tax=Clohesyomyces aquaticus TaxID=1231657 RepID=A0A1Y1ZHZ9_9PLEO|nr:hypothetical protein BCR34DRAFT_602470 [Clohesyomyces aquaticus]